MRAQKMASLLGNHFCIVDVIVISFYCIFAMSCTSACKTFLRVVNVSHLCDNSVGTYCSIVRNFCRRFGWVLVSSTTCLTISTK